MTAKTSARDPSAMPKPAVDPETVTISGYVVDERYGPSSVPTADPADPSRPHPRIGEPGSFPFTRGVHSTMYRSRLYVDGAVTSNIIYGGAVRRQDSFGATWKRRFPGEPVPTLRYWVVLNNYASAQPQTVQPTWPSVIQRSLEVAVRASTTIALRHLYAMAEVTRLRGDGEVEVRWAAVPNTWKPPEDGIFREATMRSLSDLGRTMGADPATWQSESP